MRALAEAHRADPDATPLLLTLDDDRELEVDGVALRAVPAWRWLLDASA